MAKENEKLKKDLIKILEKRRDCTPEQANKLADIIISGEKNDFVFVKKIIITLDKKRRGFDATNEFIDIIEMQLEDQLEKCEELENKCTSLESSNKQWENQYGELQKKYEELKKISEDILSKQYLDLQERLHEIEICKPYGDFFEQTVSSLQILLGFAEVADKLAEEKQEYYVWDKIADPVIETVKNMSGEIKSGMLFLPGETGAFDREGSKKDIEGVSLTDIEKYIQENELKERPGKIALQKRAIVQELGNIIIELEKMDRSLPVDKEKVKSLAQDTRDVLEKHGIYPMFANDSRLERYQELQERFSPPNAHSIRYPGFFIQREGEWDVQGAHIGMDTVERKTSKN